MAYINDTNLWPISGYNYSKFNALLKGNHKHSHSAAIRASILHLTCF